MKLNKGVVKATGLSRTDLFFDDSYKQKCYELFYKKHPDAIGKKLVLWAPTFRGKANNPFILGKNYIDELQEKLGEEWYVLTKVHPHLDSKNHISNTNIPTEELLPIIDILITDYSSVIFDYILLSKPLILFVPDYEEYKQKRGFYIPLDSIPGRIVKDGKKLYEELINEYNDFDKEKIVKFSKHYMGKCDGNSTQRLFDMIINDFN